MNSVFPPPDQGIALQPPDPATCLRLYMSCYGSFCQAGRERPNCPRFQPTCTGNYCSLYFLHTTLSSDSIGRARG